MIGRRNLGVGIRAFLALLLVILAGFPLYWIINTALTPSDVLFSGESMDAARSAFCKS